MKLFSILSVITLYILAFLSGNTTSCAVYTSAILIMCFIAAFFNNNNNNNSMT